MATDTDDIPETELATLPDASIAPAKLSEIWSRKEMFHVKQDLSELIAEQTGLSRSRRIIGPVPTHREQDEQERRTRAWERMMRLIQEEADRILERIAEREVQVEKQRQEIEDRAITLRDGRKVYVTATGYVDAQGRGLSGADYADADRQRRSDSSTWEEKRANDEAHLELFRMRREIEEAKTNAARPGQNDIEMEVTAKQQQDTIRRTGELLDAGQDARSRLEPTADAKPLDDDALGGADYMAAFADTRNISYAATLDGAKESAVTKPFTAAANAENNETPDKPATRPVTYKPT